MEDEKTEVILVPESGQYMTRVVVLTDMVKRGYEEEIYVGDEEQFFSLKDDNKSVSIRWSVLEKCGKWNTIRQSLLMSEEAGIDWEDGGETLPSGWMKRPEFGQRI